MSELVAGACLIAVGSVTDVHVRQPEDPYANYEALVNIVETLKGTLPATIRIGYPGPISPIAARGNAYVAGLPQYHLAPGDRRIFLLEGGAPLRLSHLAQGILPIDQLPQIRALLASPVLTLTLTAPVSSIRPTQRVSVLASLRNSSSLPLQLRLPRDLHACCRLMSWSDIDTLPDSPFAWSAGSISPATFTPVTLQPGEAYTCTMQITAVPTARLTAPAQVYFASWIYALPADSRTPRCIASASLAFNLAPG